MIILHGDNQVASRAALSRQKLAAAKSGKQVVELSSDTTLDQVVAAVESDSLFGGTNLIIVENLFSSRPSQSKKNLITYLLNNSSSDVLIWEGRDVSGKIKEIDPKFVQRFDLPRSVFKFLDDLSLDSLLSALNSTSAEQILALLAGQLRKLIMVKEGVANLPTWQITKLKSQVSKYSLSQLLALNSMLLQIDYAQKTSSVPYDLATALQLFVVRLK